MKDDTFGLSFTAPQGALPGQPREVMGADVPPELVAYYNIGPATITTAHLWYYGDAVITYHYYAIVDMGGGVPPGRVVRGNVLSGVVFPLDEYVGADYIMYLGPQMQLATGPTPSTDYTIDNVSQGRGVIAVQASVSTLAASAAEQVAYTFTNFLFRTGRAYRVDVVGGVAGTATSGLVGIRKTNVAGAQVCAGSLFTVTAIRRSINEVFIIKNATAADITQTIVVTILPFGGGDVGIEGSNPTLPRFAMITDITSAAMAATAGVQI